MTHTKDTREAIARAARPILANLFDLGRRSVEYGEDGQCADVAVDDALDAILAALESAPQAGGDVRELLAEILRPLFEDEGEKAYADVISMGGSRGSAELAFEDAVNLFGKPYIDKALAALTATPAQPTPEVGGLVAEIDTLFERATPTPWVADLHVGEPGSDEDDRVHVIGAYGNYAKQCLVRELSTMQGNSTDRQHADALLISKLVTAWPRLRTALGGGWRPISEAPKDGAPIIAWCPKFWVNDGIAPWGRGAIVTAYWGTYIDWREDEKPCWIVIESNGTDPCEPTHWQPLPPPPQLEGET